ncbi:glycosyltransferase family 4 protein [Rossellomorea vietnamensis]|uniref:Glycosyltransferase family 4 protein n=1 Tax=Rossellomorea vietnamensis TaxID=218284 RepID=A0ACD4C9S4_9BACI|nr:glycosyltransferase family 4 protein [Rossellomorea vietnamensis]UXH45328.1 glycosyltransferase family 4 protein [Rossellomorea vietnamensis]
MKILLATFFVIPHLGGLWNYMQQLRKELTSLGHEVDLLGSGENQDFIYIFNKNEKYIGDINILNSEKNKSVTTTDFFVKRYQALIQFYESSLRKLDINQYDLIHTQDVFSTGIVNKVRPQKTALVASLHGSVAHELKHFHIKKSPTSQLAYKYFDQIEYDGASSAEYTIVANEWLKNKLIFEYKAPGKNIKILHYGYDIKNFFNKLKGQSSISAPFGKKVIIFTGRLVELKGVHFLISSLQMLKQTREDWVCWIVGDGVKFTSLQKQVNDLKLNNEVIFWGSRKDVPSLLSKSDIFVLPSLFENQPLSVIEAQLLGKAVIVSDAGGLPEMIKHRSTGIITKAGNPQHLTNAINELLENESFREVLGQNAQKWAMTFWSQEKAIKKLIKIYDQAISERKKA